MGGMAVAQTTKPDAETTKRFEAAQKAEATSIKGQWLPSTAFPMPMEEPVGAVVDGKLYIIQGLTDGGFQPMGVVYVYDPASKSWTKKSPMPEPHVHHGMTVALNDKIYVFGGFMRPARTSPGSRSTMPGSIRRPPIAGRRSLHCRPSVAAALPWRSTARST